LGLSVLLVEVQLDHKDPLAQPDCKVLLVEVQLDYRDPRVLRVPQEDQQALKDPQVFKDQQALPVRALQDQQGLLVLQVLLVEVQLDYKGH
jgi:hypothetical protein